MDIGVSVRGKRQIPSGSSVTQHCAKPGHRRPTPRAADRDIPERPDDLGCHNAIRMTGHEHANVLPGVESRQFEHPSVPEAEDDAAILVPYRL
jgi:hypothetical protein